ncbi:MAG: GxxExxY protein [Gemmatimonadaceae bacterium]|nr:GxxExxY protein [Gemmatimonadaceae bacterium]
MSALHLDVTAHIVDSAMRVHSALGAGLLESAYQARLAHALRKRGLHVEEQVPRPIIFEGVQIDIGYRIDLLVEQQVIVELKAVTKVLPVHKAQLLSYMRLAQCPVGLLLNFQVPRMREGIIRMAL